MKNSALGFLIVLGCLWIVMIFFGYLASFKKTLVAPPQSPHSGQALQDKQQSFAEETELKRKEAVDRMKQQVEDNENLRNL